jgi:hypothetical protein
MVLLDPLDRLRLQRGVEHLHALGPRATAELLTEIGAQTGEMPAIMQLLAKYERLTQEVLRRLGGDGFPPRPLHRVAA